MYKYLFIAAVIILFTSCGTQRRVTQATKTANAVIQRAGEERDALSGMDLAIYSKLEKGDVDSTLIKNAYAPLLNKLRSDLLEVLDRANRISTLAGDRANFNDRNFFSNSNTTRKDLASLDSFQRSAGYRETIYKMVDEAVATSVFKRFDMAGFFAPGVYRIPAGKGVDVFSANFKSMIDSISKQSNKYSGIPSAINVVFVGFADATPVGKAELYTELKAYSSSEEPSKEELNKILSDLRARSLLQQMKSLVVENSNAFSNFAKTRFSYIGYGKGEDIPFKNITDYTQDDERRRVVICYWAVLPDKNAIK